VVTKCQWALFRLCYLFYIFYGGDLARHIFDIMTQATENYFSCQLVHAIVMPFLLHHVLYVSFMHYFLSWRERVNLPKKFHLYRGGIHGHQFDKGLKSLAPCYSQQRWNSWTSNLTKDSNLLLTATLLLADFKENHTLLWF
jgi:hypothetical protein